MAFTPMRARTVLRVEVVPRDETCAVLRITSLAWNDELVVSEHVGSPRSVDHAARRVASHHGLEPIAEDCWRRLDPTAEPSLREGGMDVEFGGRTRA